MTAITPNTFQCFNAYVDKAMGLLTDSELRVLIFATRHIMGWQDKIAKRQGYISLSMFENGYSNNEGTIHYGGCGLSRGAIIKACANLTEFKLLTKVGLPTEDGQKWELTTDDIQWELIEARANEKNARQKKQTVKATAASLEKRGVTSTIPVTSDVTMLGTSDVTMLGNVGRTQTKPSSKPSSKPVGERVTKDDPEFDVIAKVWGISSGGWVSNIQGMLFGSKKVKGMWDRCKLNPPAYLDEVEAFGKYGKERAYDGKLPTQPDTIERWYTDFRKQAAQGKTDAQTKAIAQAKADEERRRNRIMWGLDKEVADAS